MLFVWILASTLLVSLLSLVGVLTLAVKKELLDNILFYLVGFSAGALIGGAFLHILPEAVERAGSSSRFVYYSIILGIVAFFVLERCFYWRHCHAGGCHIHAFTYLNLIGDGLHNFIDGMVIAVAYIVSIKIGIVTTIAVILHELPQEFGDFGVLIYGGFGRAKALLFNFLSALAAIAGAVLAFFISDIASGFSFFILPFTAGGFIYIATSDLIPEIHKERNFAASFGAFISFLAGIGFMAVSAVFLK